MHDVNKKVDYFVLLYYYEIMKWILLVLLYCIPSMAKQITVAVIDTGFNMAYEKEGNLCSSGHKSFVPNQSIDDNHGHGTNIVGLIKEYSNDTTYCVYIIKFFDYKNTNSYSLIQSLKYAYSLKPDIINLSGGGFSAEREEYEIVKKILDANIKLIVSAGNKHLNLNDNCVYFPACYDTRIIVVGAHDVRSSNYGDIVDVVVSGENKTAFGETMSGTSQATAIVTGTYVRYLYSRTPQSEDVAINAAIRACYIQSGLQKNVDNLTDSLTNKYTPDIVKEYGPWMITILKIQQEKKISFKWSF